MNEERPAREIRSEIVAEIPDQWNGALFSRDRLYRYALWRQFRKESVRPMMVIGLNPSTADERRDDPTIRRCINFAKREQCDALVMLNLYAFRATYPRDLWRRDPKARIGPDTDRTIREFLITRPGAVMVAAWGAEPRALPRAEAVTAIVTASHVMHSFGTTANGYPRHPLYLPQDAPMAPYTFPGSEING